MGSADACRAHLLSFPHSASPLQEHHKYSFSFGALRIFNQLTCGAVAFLFLRITDQDMFTLCKQGQMPYTGSRVDP